MRKLRDKGLEILERLIHYPDAGAQTWAATHMLPLDAEKALKVLETISNGPPSLISLGAETTIEEWKAGALDVDWFLSA